MPNDAADFVGQWLDSLGNHVYVEMMDGAAKVTLMKSTGGRPRVLWLFFDSRHQSWQCGNGMLNEVVLGQGTSDNAKVPQFASWVTKDGRVSTWTRALATDPNTGSESEAAFDASMSKGNSNVRAPLRTSEDAFDAWSRARLKTSDLKASISQTADLRSSPTDTSSPEAQSEHRNCGKARQSWYEITEEWVKSGESEEFANASNQHAEAPADGKSKRSRGGRRRRGRGARL